MLSSYNEEARSNDFFAEFQSHSNRCDVAALAACFAETFLAGGRQGTQPVRREDFLAFLSMRYKMLQALGSRDTRLALLRETRIGETHLLAATEWLVETARRDVLEEPVRVRSTFLLERRGESWRIVVYLAHDDLEALLKARLDGGQNKRGG